MYPAVALASGMLPISSHAAAPKHDQMIKADQLDYSSHPVLEPRYEYLPVSLNSQPSNAIPLAAQSITNLEFKLPSARVVNFAKSYVNYTLNAPLYVGKAIWTFEDVEDFASSVTLVGGNSAEVARIDNLGVYSKIMRKIDTPLQEFMENDDLGGLRRSRKSAGTNVTPAGYYIPGDATTLYGKDEYIESLCSQSTTVGAGGDPAVQLNLQRQFKLGILKGTVLGTDRNFYCPSDMYLRFNTVKGDNIAFASSVSAAVAPANIATVPGLTMNNVTLWLCVETNPAIIELSVASVLAGGMTYDIPYTA